MKTIIIILSLSVMNACGGKTKEVVSDPIRYPSRSDIYKRDSLFISATIFQFIENEIDIFDYFKQYKIPISKISWDVDTLIYSPDSLKIFAFVIKKIPNYENQSPDDYFNDGDDLIGFRYTKEEPWMIYYFGQCRPTGFKDYNKIRNIFRN